METHPRLAKILSFLRTQNHRFVSFRFTKKDGSERVLVARIELETQLVTRYPFNAARKGLLPVRDLALWKRTRDANQSSRFVNCAGPVTIKADGLTFQF